MKSKILQFLTIKRNLLIVFAIVVMIASFQSINSGTKHFGEVKIEYTHYNNYIIFKNSFLHLKDQKDLYTLYPEEQWDLYKYTPTFAVFFGVFALFPDFIGLNLWNLLNALLLLFAIYYLPKLTILQKGTISIILVLELITSMQNEQSNGLMAGLLILAFGLLEHRKIAFATLCIVLSVYIKLFGIVGFALFLLYPDKLKFIGYTILWAMLLFVLPLIFVDWNQYLQLFESYGNILSHDEPVSDGYSILGWLHAWFGIKANKMILALSGAMIFMIPFLKYQNYKLYAFRILTLTSILIWVVIFNHKAESPTFIIAMSGVAIWFVFSEKNKINIALFVFAFVFTTLSLTDLFPSSIRNAVIIPYALKVLPCILIWAKIIMDSLNTDYLKKLKS